MQMNNYLICAWDRNLNCLVRVFDTSDEFQKAIRYLDNYIDLELLNGYDKYNSLIYHRSYKERR